jgi:predicted AAA+ superfamily ATPase
LVFVKLTLSTDLFEANLPVLCTRLYTEIQVCFDISDVKTKFRKVNGLVEGLDFFDLPKGTIITSDLFHEETVNGKVIQSVPLWYWLLENEHHH